MSAFCILLRRIKPSSCSNGSCVLGRRAFEPARRFGRVLRTRTALCGRRFGYGRHYIINGFYSGLRRCSILELLAAMVALHATGRFHNPYFNKCSMKFAFPVFKN